MGLPLGPTFANIFMCFHETRWLRNCPADFKPIFYRRYIDDTFLLFRHHSHVQKFLAFLNSQHSNINFTCETENNNKISFLDCNIFRENNRFECSVFRKSTFTGLETSFYSFCEFRFKLNSIKTLLFRAFGVCSSYFNLHEEFSFLLCYFRNNGFCTNFLRKQINNFLSMRLSGNCNSQPASPYFYVSLPFFGLQSEKLKAELLKLLSKYLTQHNFRIVLVTNFQ